LEAHTDTLKQLGMANERQRLRRELHDSVTQTIFSMTLTTQSAALLLERNSAQVPGQLEHLNQLAQNALVELQELITRLNPAVPDMPELAEALHQHIASRHFPDDLKVALNVLAEGSLPQPVTRGLFRIVQEALNNIVKHARANQATVSLHLAEPQWVEVEDNGSGFDPACAPTAGKVGLSGMRERAAEISWDLTVTSIPGAGTRIRIEKIPSEKGQP
jgi:signal transduction histidine kinase